MFFEKLGKKTSARNGPGSRQNSRETDEQVALKQYYLRNSKTTMTITSSKPTLPPPTQIKLPNIGIKNIFHLSVDVELVL
jgi:hypothetical protein